jgi:hypothetical protein
MQPRRIRLSGIGAGTTSVFLWIAACFLSSGSLAAQEAGKQRPTERDPAEAEDAQVTYTPPLSAADRAVFVALRRKIDLDIQETPLRTFAATLAKRIGVKVVVVSGRDVRPAMRMDVQCRQTPLESALWQALTPLHLDYRVKQGHLEMTSRDSGQLATRTYSVGDLCPTVEAFNTLIDEVRSMSHESEWDEMGGWAKLTPNAAGRKFTLVHLQSDQEHVLRLLTDKRRTDKERPMDK